MKFMRTWAVTVGAAVLSLSTLFSTGCSRSVPKGAVGNIGRYNYSPSIIQTGNTLQIWWCSQGVNPLDSSQNTDAIYFSSANVTTLIFSKPILVLSETPGTWDSAYTCNPKIIGGVFDNPVGDGRTYSLAMYYVATAEVSGENNSIGVAFSNDGVHWQKYPEPVIPSSSPTGYGVGQPSVYNTDQKAAITIFYEDSNPTVHHVAAVSSDGLHFVVHGDLTTHGMNADNPYATWGDMAFDSIKREWYAIFNRPLRPPTTTGEVLEHGQYGVELYKIGQDALLTGTSAWRPIATMDTNRTGFESNFLSGFIRDAYGTLNLPYYPKIKMYTSVSYPAPSWAATPAEAATSAAAGTWILMPMESTPGALTELPFNQYFNGRIHEVTTGWVDEGGGFQLQMNIGHLSVNPTGRASRVFYGCKSGESDYFVSLDVNCEGRRVLGKQGYGYATPVPGLNLVAIYRCFSGSDHFVSLDPNCEGQTTDARLGYILP
jgi:hypothetical protein